MAAQPQRTRTGCVWNFKLLGWVCDGMGEMGILGHVLILEKCDSSRRRSEIWSLSSHAFR